MSLISEYDPLNATAIEEIPDACSYSSDSEQENIGKRNWDWCDRIVLNKIYANGKRSKFRLQCGNTRKCNRCRSAMIDRVISQLKFSVPLYCHFLNGNATTWNTWHKWFLRTKSVSDAYWRYPLDNGWCVVVCTLSRYGTEPLLSKSDARTRISQWVSERGMKGNVSRSIPPKECNNPSCKILCSPKSKQCPECGSPVTRTESKLPIEGKDAPISSLKLDDIAQRKFDRKISKEVGDSWEWDKDRIQSEASLSGMSLEQYLSKLAFDSIKESRSDDLPTLPIIPDSNV